jgi:hypothetical protein
VVHRSLGVALERRRGELDVGGEPNQLLLQAVV